MDVFSIRIVDFAQWETYISAGVGDGLCPFHRKFIKNLENFFFSKIVPGLSWTEVGGLTQSASNVHDLECKFLAFLCYTDDLREDNDVLAQI